MIALTDHDLLITIANDIKYIKKNVSQNLKNIKGHDTRLATVENWQQDWGVKTKIFVGVASFVGGIIVFISEKLWEVFVKKL